MTDTPTLETILESLRTLAVPMDKRGFSTDEYKSLFPHGRIETPIGGVEIGKNQYEKLRDRDGGKRQVLLGAMRQTLSDPVVVIAEAKNDKKAEVFIKSFREHGKTDIDTVMSVVVTKEGQRVSISTYQRKQREVINNMLIKLTQARKSGIVTQEE